MPKAEKANFKTKLVFNKVCQDNKLVWGTKVDVDQIPMGNCDISLNDPDVNGYIEPIRRRPVEQNNFLREYVQELHDNKMIEEADYASNWVAEPVLAKSKESHGKYRFAIDYRALNKHLVKYQYPLPRVDDTLAAVGGKKIFSRIDIVKAFWSINIPESQRGLTTFRACGKLYHWNRMPFGLKNGSSTF